MNCAHLVGDSAREVRLSTVCLAIFGGLGLVSVVGSEHTGEARVLPVVEPVVSMHKAPGATPSDTENKPPNITQS